jgi:hypothetical protein
MANDNDKKENGVKRLMKKCAEVWKILIGVGVVVGLIGAFYGLDSVIATEKDLDIYKKDVNAEITHLKDDILASFKQFQTQQEQMLKNQNLQFWNQKYREYLDKETDFKYRLKKDPNNQDLKGQYEFWKAKRIEAQREIDKLTKPPASPGG